MAKKQSGSIAVPFLVTVFVGLLIIGGAALFIYNYFGLSKEEELSEPIPRSVATATYEDSHTILFILDTPEERCKSTFVLMRSVPKEKKILFVGLPTNTISLIDGKQASLKESYERGGAASAESFTESTLGIEIDRYMIFNPDSFIKLCDIIGGVSYAVNVDIAELKKTSSEQYLNGSQILTLLTYPLFDGGEVQRAYTASSLISAMINQADGTRLANDFDRNFNTIINMTDSNITAVDYKEKKGAIKTMFERGTSIARFRIANGTEATNDYIIDQSFCDDLIEEYFTAPPSEEVKKTEE